MSEPGASRLPVSSSRSHTESDLRSFLGWCAERSLDPPTAQRAHIELNVAGCWRPALRLAPFGRVSRRMSVVASGT